jgi:hypothetical protein
MSMKTLLAHLVNEYTTPGLSNAGDPPKESQLEQDMATPGVDPALVHSARRGILQFIEFSEAYLQKNPPTQQIMLSEGFGVVLQNGVEVSLSDPQLSPGYVEQEGNIPISGNQMGRSGMVRSGAIDVTGKKE